VKGKLLIVSDKDDFNGPASVLMRDGYTLVFTGLYSIFEDIKIHRPFAIVINMVQLDFRFMEICGFLRMNHQFNKIYIIFLSSFLQEEVIIKALEIGADFYITTPISPLMLTSKINAIRRRFHNDFKTSTEMGSIKIDKERYHVVYNQTSITLPKKEFELLELLISKSGKVFLRHEILNSLWTGNADIRTVDVHICKLRQKLGVNSIKTIKGIGYKLSV
jgi:two-component system, OmpR family, alkaline phosphatase synthesis response regulator PhoP